MTKKTEAPGHEKKCKDRVRGHLKSRLSDLRDLWDKMMNQDEQAREDFYNYGLSFDYVTPGTFKGQKVGYFRYQISWGGPSDEFRFFVGPDFEIHKIEYWFMDWFDGAKVVLGGSALEFMGEIFEDFKDAGTVREQFDRAQEG